MSKDNKLQNERIACGCNQASCRYEFKPVDQVSFKDEQTGIVSQETKKAILFCSYCSHVEELVFGEKAIDRSSQIEEQEE